MCGRALCDFAGVTPRQLLSDDATRFRPLLCAREPASAAEAHAFLARSALYFRSSPKAPQLLHLRSRLTLFALVGTRSATRSCAPRSSCARASFQRGLRLSGCAAAFRQNGFVYFSHCPCLPGDPRIVWVKVNTPLARAALCVDVVSAEVVPVLRVALGFDTLVDVVEGVRVLLPSNSISHYHPKRFSCRFSPCFSVSFLSPFFLCFVFVPVCFCFYFCLSVSFSSPIFSLFRFRPRSPFCFRPCSSPFRVRPRFSLFCFFHRLSAMLFP